MSRFTRHRAALAGARAERQARDDELQASIARLRRAEARLRRHGPALPPGEVEALETEVVGLRAKVAADRAALRQAAAAADHAHHLLHEELSPREAVEELDDATPFLLLPVRIETCFVNVVDGPQGPVIVEAGGSPELWVRIFPDNVAVNTPEPLLTEGEVQMGRTYWTEMQSAGSDLDLQKGAWRVLAGPHGSRRAAWVARQTKPVNWPADPADLEALGELELPEPEPTKQESWSRAPRTEVMPDRFMVIPFRRDDEGNLVEVDPKLGELIPDPLIVGPDPSSAEGGFEHTDGDLTVPPEMEWLVDFNAAVHSGMGMRIPLQADEDSAFGPGFDRLLVLGLRLSSDAAEGAKLLEGLIEGHHHTGTGIGLLPKGTATNNTAAGGSGFSDTDRGEETSFAVETLAPLFNVTDDAYERSDGQRLAEALGIAYEPLQHLENSGGFDVKEAMAMNRALWPATLGYFMEYMMDPVFDSVTVEATRSFFTRYVTARGSVPTIRVGRQPYGILPTTAYSKWAWSPAELLGAAYLDRFREVTQKLEQHWHDLAPLVPHVGATDDPDGDLIGVLGMHASSVEYFRRDALGKDYTWNYLQMLGNSQAAEMMWQQWQQIGQALWTELGFDAEPPCILDIAYSDEHQLLDGPLIDSARDANGPVDLPLSETAPIGPYDGIEGHNYVRWLASSSLYTIRNQIFLAADGQERIDPPRALLYLQLRHATMRAHDDAARKVLRNQGALPDQTKCDRELTHIRDRNEVTAWGYLEADVSSVTPDLTALSMPMGDWLKTSEASALPETHGLSEVLSALEDLADLPTARLERIFAEHLDLCSYRLDAWQEGMLNRRLEALRGLAGDGDGEPDRLQGVYLGAFGWVEDLRPPTPEETPKLLAPAALPEPLRDAERPTSLDPDNAGFIHGFSLNHAVTAAILRNAYLTHADSPHAERMSINLTSERVRRALGFLEGIRNGQELAALLGYQLERGLHDPHQDLKLDQYIFALRREFPLVAEKITEVEGDEPIQAIEARNVVDGLALLDAAAPPGGGGIEYPYGVPASEMPPPGSDEALAIQAEVDRLADSMDAIGDLALAEGVYQVAQGNYDRAGAVMRAVAEGNNPPEPDIVSTPRGGAALTQRIALQIENDLDLELPENNPWGVVPFTPRAVAEPGVDKWLGSMLGDPSRIKCVVRWTEPDSEEQQEDLLEIGELGLHPIDFIYLAGEEAGSPPSAPDAGYLPGMASGLENLIGHRARRKLQIPDERPVTVVFAERTAAFSTDDRTFFELLPLVTSLRTMLTRSRPLTALDLVLPSVGDTREETNPTGIDTEELGSRMQAAIDGLDAARQNLQTAFSGVGEPATTAELDQLRAALLQVAGFGFSEAIPESATGAFAEATERLTAQAARMLELVAKKLAAAQALLDLGAEEQGEISVAQIVERHVGAAREVLGSPFKLLPKFTLDQPAELSAAYLNSGNLVRASGPLIVDEWLQGLAPVRPSIALLERVLTLAEAFGNGEAELRPLQLPHRPDDHWVAVELPDDMVMDRDFLSLVMGVAPGFDPAGEQVGLLIDDWTERVPNVREMTGIACHFNQPNAEPPQTLLLAISPELTGNWLWDDLVATLHETLDRAKRRGVDTDLLDTEGFAQLLPTALAKTTLHVLTEVATDYAVNIGHPHLLAPEWFGHG